MLKIPYFDEKNSATQIPIINIGKGHNVLKTKLDYVKLLKAMNGWFKLNYSIGEDEYDQWLKRYTNDDVYISEESSKDREALNKNLSKNQKIKGVSPNITDKSDDDSIKIREGSLNNKNLFQEDIKKKENNTIDKSELVSLSSDYSEFFSKIPYKMALDMDIPTVEIKNIYEANEKITKRLIELCIPFTLISKITFILTDHLIYSIDEIRRFVTDIDLLLEKILDCIDFIYEKKISINSDFNIEKKNVEECLNIVKHWKNFRAQAREEFPRTKDSFSALSTNLLTLNNSTDESLGEKLIEKNKTEKSKMFENAKKTIQTEKASEKLRSASDNKIINEKKQKKEIIDNFHLFLGDSQGYIKELNIDSLRFISNKQRVHDNAILSIYAAKDGNYLYTSSIDKQMKVWDTTERNVFKKSARTENKLINTKTSELIHNYNLISMAITPDKRYIFTGSYDKTMKKWCTSTHQLVKDFGEIHTDGITSLKISKNGNWLFSGSNNGELKQWDIQYQKLMKNYGVVHSAAITCMDISNSYNYLFTGSYDKTIQRIIIEKLSISDLTGMGHDDCVSCLAIDRQDKYLFSGSHDMHLKQWKISAGNFLMRDFGKVHDSFIKCLVITNDNKYVFTASKDSMQKQWKLDAGIIYKNYGKVTDAEITTLSIVKKNTIFLE